VRSSCQVHGAAISQRFPPNRTARSGCATLSTLRTMTYYERNLPHWQPDGHAIFLTWRLHGSLPSRWLRAQTTTIRNPGKDFLAIDERLDSAAIGPRWLTRPDIAEIVARTIRSGGERRHYRLHAYVIMPNHVHLLLDPLVPVPRITGAIKGVSARAANSLLDRTGKPFWQDESFDHWIRNEAEFTRIAHYIENNPVKAGLAASAQDWRWSSAWHQ
jgi:putative transposase